MKNSFQSFLKTPKYKTIGCFSLSLKNTFLLKRLRMPMLWIQSRVDYKLNLPRSYLRQLNNNKHNLAFNFLQRVWILQSLNTTWFNRGMWSQCHTSNKMVGKVQPSIINDNYTFFKRWERSRIHLLVHKLSWYMLWQMTLWAHLELNIYIDNMEITSNDWLGWLSW